MIFAILGLSAAIGLLFTGAGFPQLDTLRGEIKAHVEDTARQRKALAAVEVAEVYVKTAREQQLELAKDLAGTLSKPDVTDEELAQVLERVNAIETDAFKTMVDVRRRLVSSTTPSEWALLFPTPDAKK
jgi:hypothetical protein